MIKLNQDRTLDIKYDSRLTNKIPCFKLVVVFLKQILLEFSNPNNMVCKQHSFKHISNDSYPTLILLCVKCVLVFTKLFTDYNGTKKILSRFHLDAFLLY